jgi:hypothetical protein
LRDLFSKNAKKGFGFGEGRTEMLVTGPLMETIRNKNPGPGTYIYEPTLSRTCFTFNGKLNKEDK